MGMSSLEFDRLIESQSRLALGAPTTPAYVYSEQALETAAARAASIASDAGCKLLYTLKSCALSPALETLSAWVEGFSCSSTFEARLARESARTGQLLHCYSPAFSDSDMAEALSIVDFLSLNSFAQLGRALALRRGEASLGIRLNPEIGFADDVRYDPCRPHSKLGVPLSLFDALAERSRSAVSIDGIHVHNNCESEDLAELALTVEAMSSALRTLPNLRWVNLGGGYYLGPDTDAAPLREATAWLKSEYGASVFIEPGTALVQEAGFLVAEALDVFENDGVDVAVLDASTSHAPEVFEYSYAPRTTLSTMKGGRRTILAGRSCLAGDVFGSYELSEPLAARQRVGMMAAGSYSHSRAAPFNGIPEPHSYLLKRNGTFELASEYRYADFARRNGAAAVATS